MIEPRFDEELDEQGKMDALAAYSKTAAEGADSEVIAGNGVNSLVPFRRILEKGGVKFLAAGNFNRDNAEPKLAAGDADAIVCVFSQSLCPKSECGTSNRTLALHLDSNVSQVMRH